MTQPFNFDALLNASSREIAGGAAFLADRLQGYRKEHQPLIVASLFVLLAEAYGVEGPDVLQAAGNVTKTTLYKPNVAFEGLRLYIRNELLKGR